MNRFGATQQAIDDNLMQRVTVLKRGDLPHIDLCLEAMSDGESVTDIECLEAGYQSLYGSNHTNN